MDWVNWRLYILEADHILEKVINPIHSTYWIVSEWIWMKLVNGILVVLLENLNSLQSVSIGRIGTGSLSILYSSFVIWGIILKLNTVLL